MAVKPIPDGYHTITPYLVVEDIAKQVEFCKKAFGGEATECLEQPGGDIMHAEVKIGDSMIMMGQARGEWKPLPCALYLYVEDCDAAYKRAVEAGATSVQEPADMFYGDRNAGVKDDAGNFWWIGTHVEDLSPEELQKRSAEYRKNK